MTATPDVHTARRRYLVVGVIAPIVITAIAVVLMLVWLPEVPATVATHWSGDGGPDGFAPAWTVPLFTAVLGAGLAAIFAAMVLVPSRDGEWGPTHRLLGAVALGATTLLAVALTWSFGMQRGLDDAHDAPGVLLPLAVGVAAGLLASVAGWFAQPNVVTSGGSGATIQAVEALTLTPGERVVWVRTTTMSAAAMLAITAAIVALAVGTIALAVTGSPAWWAMLATALVLLVLACATFVFRVRVDRAGLTVRSAIGVPRFHIPLGDIADAGVTTVRPTAEFGGWGVRVGLDGRFGIVLHSGEALQVARHDGRVFVVTVDDAATAAALLEALTARRVAPSAG
ncbi:DUF1648 domain-containing protein [Agromyces sp. SYSU K20354]|uniref:DUF1648 domain-containing protein n=1 Tax=Agromyces cavernae TaxID=2898659 RepID=UPI001E472A7F|nr:DUF1648 domain-containing protein [Agromyces cavernae]MCD2443575.1 DUF1648 domain-containing protein [Agromyces cavernae]